MDWKLGWSSSVVGGDGLFPERSDLVGVIVTFDISEECERARLIRLGGRYESANVVPET